MPACLPASSRPRYSIFMCGFGGEDSLIKHKQKVELKAPPILDMEACLMFAGVHCHGKNNRHTTVFSFVVQKMSAPVVSHPCP